MKDNIVYANIHIGYTMVRLPIKDAHDLQIILSGKNVTKAETKYCNNGRGIIELLRKYETPTVSVSNNVTIDLTSLSEAEASLYTKNVVDPYVDGTTESLMGVEEFKALRNKS